MVQVTDDSDNPYETLTCFPGSRITSQELADTGFGTSSTSYHVFSQQFQPSAEHPGLGLGTRGSAYLAGLPTPLSLIQMH